MRETIRRRRLPHWDVQTAAYFVTVCLDGSIPAQGLLDIQAYRGELDRRERPKDQSEKDWKITKWKLGFGRMDQWLDRAKAVRHLHDLRIGQDVAASSGFICNASAFDLYPERGELTQTASRAA